MSVLLTLCVALSALVTPGRGTRRWEPCTGKGVQSWEPGGVPLHGQPPSLGALVGLGGTSSLPGRQGEADGRGRDEGDGEGHHSGNANGVGTRFRSRSSHRPKASQVFTCVAPWGRAMHLFQE